MTGQPPAAPIAVGQHRDRRAALRKTEPIASGAPHAVGTLQMTGLTPPSPLPIGTLQMTGMTQARIVIGTLEMTGHAPIPQISIGTLEMTGELCALGENNIAILRTALRYAVIICPTAMCAPSGACACCARADFTLDVAVSVAELAPEVFQRESAVPGMRLGTASTRSRANR